VFAQSFSDSELRDRTARRFRKRGLPTMKLTHRSHNCKHTMSGIAAHESSGGVSEMARVGKPSEKGAGKPVEENH
jgi:hypothetical protein